MEWIKKILEKHIKEDGTIDVEAAMTEVKGEFPKQAVPKTTFNDVSNDLKDAKKLIEGLKEGESVEGLQRKIKDYESQIEKSAKETKETKIKAALEGAGATDIDYMMYKMGDLEVAKDGSIVNLDNKIKELKETHSNYFGDDTSNGGGNNGGTNGYTPVDSKLSGGKPPTTYTKEQIENMSMDEINKNWDAVQASLSEIK